MVTRVCVIGAGAGGLCAVRNLMRYPDKLSVVCFEHAPVVGGTWVYNENVGIDQNKMPIHSSMYENLRTNLPKEVMAFPDFPFDRELPSFISHDQVLRYLNDYAEHFGLHKYIQLNTVVERAERKQEGRWCVTVRDTQNMSTQSKEFDSIIVCNGHYSVPIIPAIPGLDSLNGRWMHSHDYRHPEQYSGQTVLLLGAGASGIDIALDIAPHAKKVYLAHNKAVLTTTLPDNVEQIVGIDQVNGRLVTLFNGSILEIDSLLLCTGYRYSFPFLFGDSAPSIDTAEHVTPLYLHIFHIEYPTLCFVGIPKKICPFPLFDCQTNLICKVLCGEVTLPTSVEMHLDTEQEFKQRLNDGLPPRHAHTMGTRQWAYNDRLAALGRFQPIPKVVQSLYDAVHEMRTKDMTTYKTRQFRIIDDKHFETLF